MVTIQKLKTEDCATLAKLHMQYYKYHFRDLPGEKILECYYKGVANEVGSVGFVARVDGKIAGYICGVWDKTLLNKHLTRKFGPRLAAWGLVQVLSHPGSIVNLVDKTLRGNELIKKEGYELRPIIVDKAYQGKGVANRLVDRLVEDAEERGYKNIFLITEKENIRAQSFYNKMEFDFLQDFECSSQCYKLYELDIEQYKRVFQPEVTTSEQAS